MAEHSENFGKRKIAVVTTSRADYGHLYWTLKELQNRPEINLQLTALGAHFSPEFGQTFREIETDEFTINERVFNSERIGVAKISSATRKQSASGFARN